MELLLLIVTVVSLVVAFIMSAAAWRVSRAERARSAARVAALAAAAGESWPPRVEAPQEFETHIPAPEQPHSDAQERRGLRPTAVATSTTRPWSSPRIATARAVQPRVEIADLPLSITGGGFLGSAVAQPPSSGRQRGLAIAAVMLFVVLMTGGYFAIYGGDSSTISASSATAVSPLELVSLRHERRGTRLAITGLVRNPTGGAPIDKLASVVYLFDQQGKFVTSARADVDFTRLTPGDESPFVVTTDAPDSVSRYRVSFRNDAGVVAHIDRRGDEPIARELP